MSTAQQQWALLISGCVAFAGCLVMGHLVIANRGWRIDLTPTQRFVLSDHARRVLDNLEQDVTITAFLRSDDPRNRDIEDLLRRFSRATARIRYRVIDVNRNPGPAREYGVNAYGALVVESGGRRRDFTNPNEDILVAAIVQVTQPGVRRVYFLTGHGEPPLAHGAERQGYSYARTALITERYDVAELRLLGDQEVPADANVLIIAGPRRDLLTSELLRIDAYLQNGGSLLVLLDPAAAPSLSALLRRYGIEAASEIAVDSENRLFAGDYLTMLIPERSPSHPVTAAMNAPALMSRVRVIEAAEPQVAGNSAVILQSSPESWRTPDFGILRRGEAQFVPGQDRQGPVPVAASAVIRTQPDRVGRLIVIGDSDFANDSFLGYLGNRDLLLNSVNWLAGEEQLIGARRPARIPGVEQFFVSARDGRIAFILATIVEPLLVLFIGVIVYTRRRWNG